MTLSAYADRRSRLEGKAILDRHNPWFVPLDTIADNAARSGRALLSFANYDYLGLHGHPEIRAAAAAALERHGAGALGSRLVGGERLAHGAFEAALAKFIGAEACLALVSGYLTNLSIVPHLCGAKDLILMDEYCHNSLIAGAKASKAKVIAHNHNDLDHLAHLLRNHRDGHARCLLLVESVYSMDGDIVDLPRLLELKETHGAWLLVDEAHSFGVLGERGHGLSEHFGVDAGRIDLVIGTLSKALVSCGGFICARRGVVDWLKFTLPGFVFSVGLSPVITATAHAALDVIAREPERVGRLRENSGYFLRLARAAGLDTGAAAPGSGVVPVCFGDRDQTMRVSDALLAAGIYAPPIVHIGVPRSKPRIRFFLSAGHTPRQIEEAVSALVRYGAGPDGARAAP
jgi:8-amino-7-oxononanoate synthase